MAAEARHVAGPGLVPPPHAYSPAHTHAHRSSRHMRPRIRIAMLSACTAMSCVHPLSCTDVRPRCADPPSRCCPQWHTRHLTLQVCSCESVHACMHDAKNNVGLRDRISPICTLSQNGYGTYKCRGDETSLTATNIRSLLLAMHARTRTACTADEEIVVRRRLTTSLQYHYAPHALHVSITNNWNPTGDHPLNMEGRREDQHVPGARMAHTTR